MRKFAIALVIVLGLNLVSSILSLSAPVSFAQEEPAPKPESRKAKNRLVSCFGSSVKTETPYDYREAKLENFRNTTQF